MKVNRFEFLSSMFYAIALTLFEIVLLELILFGKDFTYDTMDITFGLIVAFFMITAINAYSFLFANSDLLKKYFGESLKSRLMIIATYAVIFIAYFALNMVFFKVKILYAVYLLLICIFLGFVFGKLKYKA